MTTPEKRCGACGAPTRAPSRAWIVVSHVMLAIASLCLIASATTTLVWLLRANGEPREEVAMGAMLAEDIPRDIELHVFDGIPISPEELAPLSPNQRRAIATAEEAMHSWVYTFGPFGCVLTGCGTVLSLLATVLGFRMRRWAVARCRVCNT